MKAVLIILSRDLIKRYVSFRKKINRINNVEDLDEVIESLSFFSGSSHPQKLHNEQINIFHNFYLNNKRNKIFYSQSQKIEAFPKIFL